MHIYPFPNNIKNIATILFILSVVPFLFAQEPSLDLLETKKEPAIFNESSSQDPSSKLSCLEKENLSEFQKQARSYRSQGLEFQRAGNLEAAMSLYQKAIELDPLYAIAYNDLGVVYEAKGFIDRAEESYLQSIRIDPAYLSPYTNLALLCENKRDLNKAVFYWQKRAELGSADDPWREKARQRLEEISLVLSNRPFQDVREQEVLNLLKDVTIQKSILKKDNKGLAKSYFEEAKLKFKKGDEVTALKIAVDAKSLDPANAEIEEFIDKVQARVLSR